MLYGCVAIAYPTKIFNLTPKTVKTLNTTSECTNNSVNLNTQCLTDRVQCSDQ